MNDRPNIIICLCDELRAFEVGCYGHPTIRTPHMDALAAEGARFETAVSNCPVCMPARSVLLSGQYARTCCGTLNNTVLHPREGGWLMPQFPSAGRPHCRETTLAEALRAAGFLTAAIGKWHLESWPDDLGFGHYLIPRVHHCHTAQVYVEDGGAPFAPAGWSVDFEAERVRRYLEERGRDRRPFFMFYNISPPHMPLADAPDEYLTMYRDADVVVRPNVDLSRPVHKQEWEFHTYLWDFRYYRDHLPYTRKLPAGFDLRRLMALYMGLTTWVDDALGRMLQALEAAGLADRTVVVFTSDHGDNLGSHQRMGKSTLNEESIRIPLIVRGPGVAPRAVDRQAASLVDLAPTLLEMAGVAAPPSMQGRSLAPVLRGASEEPRFNAAFIECARDGCGLRTPTHLYGLPWVGNGTLGPKPHYFHDLTTDPYQLHNLAESKEQEEAMTALDRRLRDLDRQVKWSAGRTVS